MRQLNFEITPMSDEQVARSNVLESQIMDLLDTAETYPPEAVRALLTALQHVMAQSYVAQVKRVIYGLNLMVNQ